MYLGLDLGTSGLKALIVGKDGRIAGTASASYAVSQPRPGWSEQDPDDWLRACESVFETLRADHAAEYEQIRAISLSGHMHGAVVVDRRGTPLRPCILWNDMRSAAPAAKLDQIPAFRAISGNIVFPGFTAPKLLWMQEHEPEIFAGVHKVLMPKDYVLHWLTGRFATDVSDAAGTSWLDVGARDWSDELLQAGGMDRDQMPELYEGCQSIGPLRADLARQHGLSEAINIVAGGADNAVAACGVGVVREGQGFVSLGTSGVLLAAKDCYAPAPDSAVHTFCHAVPGHWYQMGVTLSATNSLNWLAKTLGTDAPGLAGLCEGPITGPSGVMFLPYLTGERTPHNDADVGGAFVGLKADTDARDLAQAVMEGVCFALRDCLQALTSTGTELHEILAIGGGTKSGFWVQTLATILNLNLLIPEKGEFGAALGAARLAMIGDGAPIGKTLTPPKIASRITPDTTLRPAYEAAYRRFRKLYPLVKEAK